MLNVLQVGIHVIDYRLDDHAAHRSRLNTRGDHRRRPDIGFVLGFGRVVGRVLGKQGVAHGVGRRASHAC